MATPPRTAFLALCLLLGLPAVVSAGLIIDPTNNGTAVLNQSQFDLHSGLIDDQIFDSNFASLPATFKYFGTNLNQLSISANGNLTDLVGSDTFFTSSFAQGHATLRIAPLWDDYLFLDPTLAPGQPANQIYERVTSQYYAVTWHNVRLHLETNVPAVFPYSLMSSQVLMFVAETTLRGFQFKPNDIVFGYTSQTGSTGQFSSVLEAETGLNRSVGNYSRLSLPDAQLLNDSIAASLLPWQPNSALLFRPVVDGNGDFVNYNVSTISLSAVPEPVTMGWLSILTVACLRATIGKRRRRRHVTQPNVSKHAVESAADAAC